MRNGTTAGTRVDRQRTIDGQDHEMILAGGVEAHDLRNDPRPAGGQVEIPRHLYDKPPAHRSLRNQHNPLPSTRFRVEQLPDIGGIHGHDRQFRRHADRELRTMPPLDFKQQVRPQFPAPVAGL